MPMASGGGSFSFCWSLAPGIILRVGREEQRTCFIHYSYFLSWACSCAASFLFVFFSFLLCSSISRIPEAKNTGGHVKPPPDFACLTLPIKCIQTELFHLAARSYSEKIFPFHFFSLKNFVFLLCIHPSSLSVCQSEGFDEGCPGLHGFARKRRLSVCFPASFLASTAQNFERKGRGMRYRFERERTHSLTQRTTTAAD